MIARPQDLPVVVSQFAVPLSQLPGFVALYSLVLVAGTHRLQWDGLASRSRIPLEYRLQET